MDLLQLRYFKAVAECQNLTQAAAGLFISPPALSATISRLEKELGVQLFDRKGNRLYLNDNGASFLKQVSHILSLLDTSVENLRNSEEENGRYLSVATTSPNVWGRLFSSFQLEHPEVFLTHTALRLDELQNPECLNRYDLIIASPGDIPSSWAEQADGEMLYDDDSPVLLLHPEHPLAKRRQISMQEIRNETFVALSPGFSSRKYFDDLCRRAGFTPNIAMECDYMMRSYMVMKQIGVAVATAYTNSSRLSDGTCYVDIAEPVFPRIQAVFFRQNRQSKTSVSKFLKFSRRFYPNYSCRTSS